MFLTVRRAFFIVYLVFLSWLRIFVFNLTRACWQVAFRKTRIFAVGIAVAFSAHIGGANAACPFDLDGDTIVSATTDGLLALRLMNNMTEATLRTNASTAPIAPRASAAAMRGFAGSQLLAFDFDGDGRVLPATDGAILMRWLLGIRGDALVAGAVAAGAPRNTGALVAAFINNGCSPIGTVKTFTASTASFNTPERGFWRWLTDANSNFTNITATAPGWLTSNGITVAYAPVRLDAFRNAPLTPAFLTQLQTAFDYARLGGVKLILRFAYNYPSSETEYLDAQDAPLARVLEHITQLAPILNANADIISVWQAGFIGAWGEGHTSSNGLTSAANKITVRDALLAAAPSGVLMQWRYPPDLMQWSPAVAGETDAESQAFSGTLSARMGAHNDCFLASDTDVGTYDENALIRASERSYVASRSAITPYHVETCNASPTTKRSTCVDILREGAQFHVVGINRDYDTAFHTQWQAEGCFATVEQKQGYRLELLRALLPEIITRGNPAVAHVDLRNVGWARIYRQRGATLELVHRVNSGNTVTSSTTADLRRALPDSSSFTLPFVIAPGASLAPGSYRAFLRFADPSARLAVDPRFSIRPAAADDAPGGARWDAVAGRFDLGIDVQIQ